MDTVLVLDVGYQPVRVAPWQSAIVWVLEKTVEVIDIYPEKYIRTPRWQVNMPSIVRLIKPINRKRAIKFSRQNVYLRDKERCQYCGNRVARNSFTYDHVIPRTQGGKTEWQNVVCSCINCNQKKGGRTPAQAGMRLLSTPTKPKSLPQIDSLSITYRSGMPESWKDYLRNAVYWEGELEK